MGNDFDKISDFENLYRAHLKARRGKRNKNEVIRFENNLGENLWHLKRTLEDGSYRVQGYRKFMIFDPKTREIQALSYEHRVVQHSLCDNVLAPFFEPRLIYDNAACREGKGTHFAMRRLTGFLTDYYRTKGTDRGYVLKCDIRKYFNSIDHDVLKGKLVRIIKDEKLRELLWIIIDSYHYDAGCSAPCGLPMGNQTSQWFALYYIDSLDRLCKERYGVKYYSRYMDDIIIIHDDKIVWLKSPTLTFYHIFVF